MSERLSDTAAPVSDREIVVSRMLEAPRELVWQAWTDPDQVVLWWGPRGFTTTTQAMKVRVGGSWRFIMHGPDGTDYENEISYLEVAPPERLVYKHGGSGWSIDDVPAQFHVTVTFEEDGAGTRLTMRSVFASREARDFVIREVGALEGANQTLDRLAEHVAARSKV